MFSTDRMTIAAVAEHLGVSRWTVSRLIDAGEIKSAPGRGGFRIPTADYAAWVNRQTVSPEQKDGDMPVTELPTMFAFEDVAEKYRLSLRSLKEAARARKFAHTRIGTQRYFTDAQLQAFLAARSVESTQDASRDGMRDRRARRTQRRTAAA